MRERKGEREEGAGKGESTPRLSFSQFSVSLFLIIQLERRWLGNIVTPDGYSEWSCCDVINGKWSMLLFFWTRNAEWESKQDCIELRIVIIISQPEVTWYLPVSYFISQENSVVMIFINPLEQVILGFGMLNQVKSKSFDSSCVVNCRKAQHGCQVTTATRNLEWGSGREAQFDILSSLAWVSWV